MRSSEPLLSVHDLDVHYGEIRALSRVSIEVCEGEIVALLGANGAGKSTTIKTVMGLLRPSAGRIVFDGDSIGGLGAAVVSRRGIALSPEGRRVFSSLSVRSNLIMGAYGRRDRKAVRADVETWLDRFPRLREREHQAAGTLSGGEQQMLAISRALMGRPRMLLLDEPSLGMAPLTIQTMAESIRAIHAERGTTVLLVEQNADLALGLASRGYVLALGSVAFAGTRDQLASSSEVQAAYLGERGAS